MEIDASGRVHIAIATQPHTLFHGMNGAERAKADKSENSVIWPYLNNRFGRWLELSIKANANGDEQQERDAISENLDVQFTPAGRQLVQNEWYGRTHPFTSYANRQLLEVLRNCP